MEQISVKQIDAVFERIAKAYEDSGERLTLTEGRQSEGRPWQLHFDHGSLGEFTTLSNGVLGWTRREAYQTLRGIEAGMEAQKLLQAQDIRDASGWVEEGARDGGGLLRRLHKLAPPTEF